MSNGTAIDYGVLAQQAAEDRLDQLDAALNEDTDWPDDMFAPYDGCQTCVIREVLIAAWPFIEQHARTLDDEP